MSTRKRTPLGCPELSGLHPGKGGIPLDTWGRTVKKERKSTGKTWHELLSWHAQDRTGWRRFIEALFWRVDAESSPKRTIYGKFQRHGHYNSEIFGDFRSSFHIPASVKSQIIHSHHKAVIMDSGSYEVEINCLNQL